MRYQNASVLVVDDLTPVRRLVSELLRDAGFRWVDEAADGPTALEQIRATAYDLVITAWQMEALAGPALLSLIRQWPERSRTSVLVLTAADPREALQAGADGVVAKPFRISELLGQVLRLVIAVPARPTPDPGTSTHR